MLSLKDFYIPKRGETCLRLFISYKSENEESVKSSFFGTFTDLISSVLCGIILKTSS
uniref:Uncharacterized protein n=1 Tax=Anguilla anguilla TaxID=7936 RepID=A0A0E9W799_ANGAN